MTWKIVPLVTTIMLTKCRLLLCSLLLFDFEHVCRFCQLSKNTYCDPLFEQLNSRQHCRMLETRRTLVASKKVLLLTSIFYFSLCSSADAQTSRMRSGLFKKVIWDSVSTNILTKVDLERYKFFVLTKQNIFSQVSIDLSTWPTETSLEMSILILIRFLDNKINCLF